ncbi:hypothetical protein [Pseudobacter ginsenosidimutans]|uniref:Uncharacterized protein n=1 Tax=Pseudobacter ginsenosidimutans TaxID=661488 RepID=A0A4Q7MBZ7_9BACT|nr:hypothetical protein [Pseudobacter ginsenosidimutans]QEC45227.1 hypothetical protein FSB84_27360 [Pseudobacter ginsenosidimutans]RZS65494.1 hypothetical protein EV199_5668 [Pseudobacter ginsenosidimutans]
MYKIKQLSYWILLLTVMLGSCQKAEQVETFKDFVEVSFDATKVALANNGQGIFIAAKYNGYPIEWDVFLKKIKVVEGEGKFEFYDIRTGKTVLEKTIDVKAGSEETHTLFQPTLESPVTFIDSKSQEKEEAAPEGHIKLKIANYVQYLIPFSKVDVKMYITYFDEDWNEVREEIGMIYDIANDVNGGEYQLLPDGVPEGLTDYSYLFEFFDHETGQPLLNYGGTTYSTYAFAPAGIDPLPVKKVFTVYLAPMKAWGETPFFLKKDEDFWEVSCNVLFAN